MTLPPCTTAYFDVAASIAFVQISADGRRISTFCVYPEAAAVLHELARKGVRLGFIFPVSGISEDEVRTTMETAGLRGFDDRLLVVPRWPIPVGTFRRAAALARTPGECENERLLFVSTQATDLARARKADFLTALEPRQAWAALRGHPLQYLRILVPPGKDRGDWVAALRAQPLTSLHVAPGPMDGTAATLYAVADPRTAAVLDDLGFWVDRLGAPDAPGTTTLYMVRDDQQVESGFLSPTGNASSFFGSDAAATQVLASTREGILVALPVETPIESLRFAGTREGHVRKLSPPLNVLQDGSRVAARAVELSKAAAADPLCDRELGILDCNITPEFMASAVARYVVIGNDTTQKPFGSRHVRHAGNRLAVEALVADLGGASPGRITVERHHFPSNDDEFTNVVATLPARGKDGDGVDMKEQGIVVVSAHLDSTANLDRPYDAETDPAPGADDDASGMVAVLAAAHAFAELVSLGRPHREVRFALFNCEEIDKAGSGTYAAAQAALGVKVAAVFHMDMIGRRKTSSRFEVHAGFPWPDVPDAGAAAARSAEQAHLIEHLRPILTPLPETDLSTLPEENGADRSDHTRFHAVGFPACWVTQDFFSDEGADDPNPAYHTMRDTDIVEEYAAQVARLVGAAAWIAATR